MCYFRGFFFEDREVEIVIVILFYIWFFNYLICLEMELVNFVVVCNFFEDIDIFGNLIKIWKLIYIFKNLYIILKCYLIFEIYLGIFIVFMILVKNSGDIESFSVLEIFK